MINVSLGILAHTWVVAIGANHNVFPILELCPRVGTAAAVARQGTPTPTVTAVGVGGPVGRMTAAGCVTPDCVLGLTEVRTNDGVA